MGYPTNIEWTDATWNPIGGCSVHSPGCINCYAMRIAGSGKLDYHPLYAGVTTMQKGRPVFNGKLTVLPDDHPTWIWPLKWRGARSPVIDRENERDRQMDTQYLGRLVPAPSLIFVGDMSDLFHENRPRAVIDKVVGVCSVCDHIAQLLTKRADVMAAYFKHADVLPNVWLGFSAERQQEFDERWPHMRRLAELGWTIFVSVEPMIGAVRLPPDFLALGNRAQIITGGESGPPDKRRPTSGSDGEATRALYAELEKLGPVGHVAVNLFRACKCSERAKVYRGGERGRGSYRSMAYGRKEWAIENLCGVLAAAGYIHNE